MITSSSIQYVSRILNEPRSLTDMDKESVAAMVKEFPYFTPARYMEAALAHREDPHGENLVSTQWLYMGNWLLFNDFISETIVVEEKKPHAPQKIKFSLTTVEPEPAIVVAAPIMTAPAPPPAMPKVDYAVNTEKEQPAAPVIKEERVHSETAAEAMPPIKQEETTANEETVATTAIKEAEVAPKTEEKGEIVQPLIIKEDLLKEDLTYLHESTASMYVDNDEEYSDEDDLIIKPLNYTIEHYDFNKEQITNQNGDTLILPVYTDNYFFHQGIKVSDEIPEEMDMINKQPATPEDVKDKSLMIMMSFSEWLLHFKTKTQKEIEEQEDKKALKSMWQQEKLAAANDYESDEENDEIPEDVFNMAVNSITKEEDLASEALAQIHRKQGKYDRAIDMYRKLSLRNPQKLAYFAHKIEELLKEKEL